MWNKPKGSTYAGMAAVLYLDGNGHVQWWGAGLWLDPVQDARTRLMGIYGQLTDEQRRRYDVLVRVSR